MLFAAPKYYKLMAIRLIYMRRESEMICRRPLNHREMLIKSNTTKLTSSQEISPLGISTISRKIPSQVRRSLSLQKQPQGKVSCIIVSRTSDKNAQLGFFMSAKQKLRKESLAIIVVMA